MSASADDRPLLTIAPPVPAPYLAGVPRLPDDLLKTMRERRRLSVAESQRARRILRDLRKRLFEEREKFESSNSVKIESEPTPEFG